MLIRIQPTIRLQKYWELMLYFENLTAQDNVEELSKHEWVNTIKS